MFTKIVLELQPDVPLNFTIKNVTHCQFNVLYRSLDCKIKEYKNRAYDFLVLSLDVANS